MGIIPIPQIVPDDYFLTTGEGRAKVWQLQEEVVGIILALHPNHPCVATYQRYLDRLAALLAWMERPRDGATYLECVREGGVITLRPVCTVELKKARFIERGGKRAAKNGPSLGSDALGGTGGRLDAPEAPEGAE